MKRILEVVSGISLATALAVATNAIAAAGTASDNARLASQYASWAGGRANADSIVNGLRTGSSVTLVTRGPGNTKSIAGFTAQTTLATDEIAAALAAAKRSLASMGVREPTAEQMQAALIGGELALPNGKTRLVQGTVALRAEPTPVAAVASR
jgi:hypothetical protein